MIGLYNHPLAITCLMHTRCLSSASPGFSTVSVYEVEMTNSNSKESVDKKFSGKPGKGLTFEEFDLKVLSWGRKQNGKAYATPLWENNLPDIRDLDLTDDLDNYVFEEHCEFVYDVLEHVSTKNADTLYNAPKFWTVK